MAIIIGSLFYNLPNDTSSFFGRGVLLFFTILTNAFLGAFEVCLLDLLSIYLPLTKIKGSCLVGAKAYRSETLSIRFLPSVLRSYCVNGLRLTQQAYVNVVL